MKISKFFKLTAAMLACVFAMAITSCDNDDEPKGSELKFDPANVTVTPGATATVTASGGTTPYTVASGDAKIATAKAENSTITVTGVKEGTATITVTDAKQIKGKFAVSVKKSAESDLDFDKKSVSVAVGKEETVTVKGGTKPFTANHDYNRFTQHPMLFAAKYGMLPDNKPYYRQYGETSIGNDVWIGCNTLIIGGVTIGDGAIIGAGARISRNVPPYSIVVGNNRHLKDRFSDEVIAELLNLKWWDFPIDVIRQNIGLFSKKPDSNTIRLMSEIKNNLNI